MSVLQTPRLVMRWLDFSDAPFLLELLNSPGWLRWIGDRQVRTLEDARNYVRNGPMALREKFGYALLQVSLKTDDQPIGICGLLKRAHLDTPDIGFAFLPAFSGMGYALEAAQAVLQWGRALGERRVLAITLPDNQASIRLLDKLGMQQQGLLPINEQGEALLLLATPDEVPLRASGES
jgi:RimJ/RimL family protein N-acetyltransferase